MTMKREDFVKKWSPLVQTITRGTGLFPETVLAQAIIESQSPKTSLVPGTTLATKYNNYFGIKSGSGWKGKTVSLKTGEVFNGTPVVITDAFRVYETPEDSFRDYVKFLKSNSRYTKAGVFTAATPALQAAALQKAGYATNPSYAELIASVQRGISKWITPTNTGIVAAVIATIFFFIIYNKNKA
jgi:flagellum-specific peptidoglycan hydrolase FlgJ